MKKILVTGATGFIGNYVIKELLENNCKVIATSSHEEKAKETSWYSQVNYIPFDLASFDESINYFKFFDEPDAMIHLAWEGLPNYTRSFHLERNLPRQFAFLQNMLQNGLPDITVTGTCFEYGMKEGCLTEGMEAEPANAYAVAKNELRKQLSELSLQIPFKFKWVRLFYMYGKGQGSGSLIAQLDKALENNEKEFKMSGGAQVRDFLPVEKVAKYIVVIALQQKMTGIINCCSGQPVTVKDLVENYLKSINKSISLHLGYYPYPEREPMEFWGDNTRLKLVLHTD